MKKLLQYICDYDYVPNDDEIKECLRIANEKHCVIRLEWNVRYSGRFQMTIREEMTLEECKQRLPKVYGV